MLITSDSQHWNALGLRNRDLQTPNLDRLASQGVVFSRAYCANPTCTPTRSSIITGRYPSQHGAWSLGTKLPENELTVGDVFRKAGYRTALVGKAHFHPTRTTDEFPSLESMPLLQDLNFWRGFHGPFYGFDHVELARNHTDEYLVGQHYALWMEENGCPNWRDYFRPPVGNNDRQRWRWEIPERYHYDTWITERVIALVDEFHNQNLPFFLWASFFDPHPPYLAPEPWDTMYDPASVKPPESVIAEDEANLHYFKGSRQEDTSFSTWNERMHGFRAHLADRDIPSKDVAVYYGMISLMDKYIGKILASLETHGLADDTLLIFTTDHGHLFGQHESSSSGAFHYEDLLRVPFILRWPGRVPAGKESDALQSQVDLSPTLLDCIGMAVPRTMTGISQKEVWLGEAASCRDHVIIENRQGPESIHAKTYLDERYKITVYYQEPFGEIYDLRDDPGETRNLWNYSDCASLKERLLLKFIQAEMGKEPSWMPRISWA